MGATIIEQIAFRSAQVSSRKVISAMLTQAYERYRKDKSKENREAYEDLLRQYAGPVTSENGQREMAI
jgi:hypothetical protein